eukprot:403366624
MEGSQDISVFNDIKITGGCHCQSVRFEALAPQKVEVYKCNCSICLMKQNHHFVVQHDKFTLISGEDSLQKYTFNTKKAVHLFCKNCGICSFYQPRSNPDCYAITIYCVDGWNQGVFPGGIEWKTFDGQNWENEILTNEITKFSKTEE